MNKVAAFAGGSTLIYGVLAIMMGVEPGAQQVGPLDQGKPPPLATADVVTVLSADDSDDTDRGRALFTNNCAPCHQVNGEGIPGAFPALKGNGAVNREDAVPHIRIVLFGLKGAKVGGFDYVSAMPAFAASLGDADIVSIINYERSSWGNHGGPVTTSQVAAERARQ